MWASDLPPLCSQLRAGALSLGRLASALGGGAVLWPGDKATTPLGLCVGEGKCRRRRVRRFDFESHSRRQLSDGWEMPLLWAFVFYPIK